MTPNSYASLILLHISSTRCLHSLAGSRFAKQGSRIDIHNLLTPSSKRTSSPNSCKVRAPSDLNPPKRSLTHPTRSQRDPIPHPTHTRAHEVQYLQAFHAPVPAGPPAWQNPSPISTKLPGTTPHTRRPRFCSSRPGGPLRLPRKKFPQVSAPQLPNAGPTSGATRVDS